MGPAKLKKRIIAFGFDYLIISAYLIFLTLLSFWGQVSSFLLVLFENPMEADLFFFAVLLLPVLLYFAISESSMKRGSWGKQKANIQVTNQSGGRITTGQAIGRNALKLLPWQITHTCIFHIDGWPFNVENLSLAVNIGLISVWVLVAIFLVTMLISKKNQTLYDLVSGSYVTFRE